MRRLLDNLDIMRSRLNPAGLVFIAVALIIGIGVAVCLASFLVVCISAVISAWLFPVIPI